MSKIISRLFDMNKFLSFTCGILMSLFFANQTLFAASLSESKWENGQTLLTFFEKNKIPQKVYYNLPVEDKELADEIMSGQTFYTLHDGNTLIQALIPINEDLQLHIFKKGDTYGMQSIPVAHFSETMEVSLPIESSVYEDITKYTGDNLLASYFISGFRSSVDFKRQIQKDNKIAIIYERKYRLGKYYGSPNIKAATINLKDENKYIIKHQDGNFYDLKGNSLSKYLLTVPLTYKRISSHFSSGRKHPILGYKRPHLGTDYAAPRHTPIYAAGKGKVIFAGKKGGYGNTVIIQHDDGYRTLYGHMHKIDKSIKTGMYVAQGRKIGSVGSTGLSTGPHLHFGLYKNGNAVNPQKYLKIATSKLKEKEKEEFLVIANSYKNKLDSNIANNTTSEIFKSKDTSYVVYLNQNNSSNSIN